MAETKKFLDFTGLTRYDENLKSFVSNITGDKSNLTTTNKTNLVSAVNEVNSIAKGATVALVANNYSALVTSFSGLGKDVYKIGQSVYIKTLEVPDVWVSEISNESSTYTYTTDAQVIDDLNAGTFKVGYYTFSKLETQKVDLTDYATSTDLSNLESDINEELDKKMDKELEETISSAIVDLENKIENVEIETTKKVSTEYIQELSDLEKEVARTNINALSTEDGEVLAGALADINQRIDDNELITAAAINSLRDELENVVSGEYYEKQYLTFEALESGTFSFSQAGLSYSLNGGSTWTALSAGASTPIVQAGGRVLWKNNTTLTPSSANGIGTFSSTGQFNSKGNIMSLYFGDNFYGQKSLEGKNYAFYKLFKNCSKLLKAPELPATILASSCYANMFEGDTLLSSAPTLPAIQLYSSCYFCMFMDCTSLEQAPELPAIGIASSCYKYMFSGCTSLTSAPELLAPYLSEDCYGYMFRNCTSLEKAPELPATTLVDYCYQYMFFGCTSLWDAPLLAATTLTQNCYSGIFSGCTSLEYIKMLATNISASNCLKDWLKDASSFGELVKSASMSSLPEGASGIPSGWIVYDNESTNTSGSVAKEGTRRIVVSSNLTNQTTSIGPGESETVVYVNSGNTTNYTIAVSSTYITPFGDAIELTCPKGGYCEVNYINIGGVIYARGL